LSMISFTPFSIGPCISKAFTVTFTSIITCKRHQGECVERERSCFVISKQPMVRVFVRRFPFSHHRFPTFIVAPMWMLSMYIPLSSSWASIIIYGPCTCVVTYFNSKCILWHVSCFWGWVVPWLDSIILDTMWSWRAWDSKYLNPKFMMFIIDFHKVTLDNILCCGISYLEHFGRFLYARVPIVQLVGKKSHTNLTAP
jgi:hypothetical protein